MGSLSIGRRDSSTSGTPAPSPAMDGKILEHIPIFSGTIHPAQENVTNRYLDISKSVAIHVSKILGHNPTFSGTIHPTQEKCMCKHILSNTYTNYTMHITCNDI